MPSAQFRLPLPQCPESYLVLASQVNTLRFDTFALTLTFNAVNVEKPKHSDPQSS